MQNKQPTGKQLFLRYAFACAESKLATKKISQSEFNTLKLLIYNGDNPTQKILQKCFPLAFRKYGEYCRKIRSKIDFSFTTVSLYWRYHHMGETPTQKATVCVVENEKIVKVTYNGEMMSTLNLYGLPLNKPKMTVFVHNSIIVETLD